MSNTLINCSAKVSTDDGPVPGLARSFTLVKSGQPYLCQIQSVTNTPEAMATGDCADFRYAAIINPAASAQTLTVTAAPMLLKPGDIAIFPPSSTAVTLQATGSMSPQVFASQS